jgi:hypothetical protein
MRLLLPTLLVPALLSSGAFCDDGGPQSKQRAEWLYSAGWGVFTHYLSDMYLSDTEATPEKWNAIVEGVDVQALAEQLASVGAHYYVITLGQNSGYFCSPNDTYDSLVGNNPGHTSRRDLVNDLYAPLNAKGIRLMVYLPSGAPDRDAKAVKALAWERGNFRNKEFQQKWERVIAEWSRRWGAKVAGWWFDGCYYADAMYRDPEPPNFFSLANAARAGNADSIVAFNPGVLVPIVCHSTEEDYTAGEIDDPAKVVCPGRFIEGVQFQMLSYLGPWWGKGEPRFSNEQVINWTLEILRKGGAVTWDLGIGQTGTLQPAALKQLGALNQGLEAAGMNLPR